MVKLLLEVAGLARPDEEKASDSVTSAERRTRERVTREEISRLFADDLRRHIG